MGVCTSNSSDQHVAHRRETWSQGLQKFLRQSAGSTAAEYAIVLALIVTGVFFAGQALNHATNRSFEQIALMNSAETPSDSFLPAGDADEQETAQDHWVGENSVLIERSAMIMILIACFYLVRQQRRVDAKRLADSEKKNALLLDQPQVYLKRQQIYHVLSTNIDSLFNSQVQVQHLMSKRVTTVKPQATVARMKALMFEKQVRHLLVCDEARNLLGIISDRDLYCSESLIAEEVMTSKPITVPPNALVSAVISLMLKEKISALPIVLDGRIYGMMTTTDLIMAMQCALQLLRQANDEHTASSEQELETNPETVDVPQQEAELVLSH